MCTLLWGDGGLFDLTRNLSTQILVRQIVTILKKNKTKQFKVISIKLILNKKTHKIVLISTKFYFDYSIVLKIYPSIFKPKCQNMSFSRFNFNKRLPVKWCFNVWDHYIQLYIHHKISGFIHAIDALGESKKYLNRGKLIFKNLMWTLFLALLKQLRFYL